MKRSHDGEVKDERKHKDNKVEEEPPSSQHQQQEEAPADSSSGQQDKAEWEYKAGDSFVGFECEVPEPPAGFAWVPGNTQGHYILIDERSD